MIVSHREVEKDMYYPLNDGVAFVDIYMDEYQLIFVDHDDNRYIGSVEFTLRRLMDDPGLLKECYRMDPEPADDPNEPKRTCHEVSEDG